MQIVKSMLGLLKVGCALSVHGQVKKCEERKESEGRRLTESAQGKHRGKDNGTSGERNKERMES